MRRITDGARPNSRHPTCVMAGARRCDAAFEGASPTPTHHAPAQPLAAPAHRAAAPVHRVPAHKHRHARADGSPGARPPRWHGTQGHMGHHHGAMPCSRAKNHTPHQCNDGHDNHRTHHKLCVPPSTPPPCLPRDTTQPATDREARQQAARTPGALSEQAAPAETPLVVCDVTDTAPATANITCAL